jgi:hypothetical protein
MTHNHIFTKLPQPIAISNNHNLGSKYPINGAVLLQIRVGLCNGSWLQKNYTWQIYLWL